MSAGRLATDDYPLAEKSADLVTGPRGKPLADITLEAVKAGGVTMEDLRITPGALLKQAEIARAAGRPRLAQNFERAAEMVKVPQEEIMRVYELLRPGRAKGKEPLIEAARRLRAIYGAERLADFLEEAADVYERRGLFQTRY